MPVLARLPVSQPRCRLTPPPVARRRCPPFRWFGCPILLRGVGPLVRLPDPSTRGAVHADPVSRAYAGGVCRTSDFGRSWGASGPWFDCFVARGLRQAGDSVPRSWSFRSPLRLPGARRFKLRSSARRSGCPALVASDLAASRPDRNRSRLVSRARFPPDSPRRLPPKDSLSRPRLACALRYGAYLRERETPGQEVFLNPQGYPRNFSSIPRICRSSTVRTQRRTQRCPQPAASSDVSGA